MAIFKNQTKDLLAKVLVFSLLLFSFYTGWPRLSPQLPFPPKVQEAKAAISLVTSGAINGAATNGNNVTLTFPAGVQQYDIVILYGGHPHRASTNLGPVTSGYTAIATHTAAAPNFGAWYKVMGATPDTSVEGYGTGNTADATAYAAYIIRGVSSTVFDQTTVTTGPTTSTNPNPAAITTQTANAWVLALAGSQVNDASRGTVTNYSNLNGNSGNDTNDISVDGGTREIASAGSEDPGAWSTWASGAWYAITVALKPDAAPTITVNEPDGVSDTVTQGDNYTINYDLADSDSTVTANFAYDTDAAGYDGTLIAGCIERAEGTSVTCVWNTTGVTPGTYYVHGTTTDAVTAAQDYSAGQVTINAAASGAFDVTASSSQSFDSSVTVSFTSQTSTMTNVGAIQIVDDRGTSAGWTLNQTGNDWKTTTANYEMDYNGDGADNGSGKLCVFPSGANLYAEAGSLTGVTKGGNDCFGSALSTIDLVTASSGNGNGTYWLTDMTLEQLVPANPTAAVYTTTIIFTLQ